MSTVASRLRLTEGQLYTSVLTLLVAVLLLTGLGNVHGVPRTDLTAGSPVLSPGAPLAPVPPVAPVVPAPVALPPVQVPGPLPLAPVLPLAPQPLPGEPVPAPAPTPSAAPAPTAPSPPPAAPCALQDGYDAAVALLQALDGPTGGALPTQDVAAALGVVTGCDPADPLVVVVGLLIGLGEALPDPGLPPLPPVPFVEVPAPVVTALQPARPVLDEACGAVGLGQTVASLFVTAYPQPVPQLTTQVLFTALSVCGQVRQP